MTKYKMEISSQGRPVLGVLLRVIIVAFIAGCGGVPVVGLHPEYPPVERRAFALYSDFVVVDSLQPTFSWEPFPRPEDLKVDEEGVLKRIEVVTYELRVWKTLAGESGTLVYTREGLTVPYHQLEDSLDPSSQYLWTVRAHFTIDGRLHFIEWGLAGNLLRAQTVPNPSCFRFKTPEK
ncbi:MAG: hypothetical protein JSU72_18940 [Deltaproteobacteria bacterium]|nr:MAG: hypothetical protein JSU72_18940 [Deltaproteobacteria bacterium]